MGDLVVLGVSGRTCRLDLLPPETGDDGGYRNVLPGYHTLRVLRDDGLWLGLDLFLTPDDDRVAAFRLDGDRFIDARHEPLPPRDRRRDVLAQAAAGARAWQAATSALDAAFYANPPKHPEAFNLPVLQAMFVQVAFCEPYLASANLTKLVARLAEPARLAGAPAAAVELARSLGAMVALVPRLAADLPLDDVVGALSEVGNARGEVDLIAAASRLQLQLSKQN